MIRLITIYDCRLSLKWIGVAKDGTAVEGTVTIPEVSHEITLDGLSDYVVRPLFLLPTYLPTNQLNPHNLIILSHPPLVQLHTQNRLLSTRQFPLRPRQIPFTPRTRIQIRRIPKRINRNAWKRSHSKHTS